MIRIRYMLVDHDVSHDGKLGTDGGAFTHVPSIHTLCPVHHWVRLDDNTIFVKASYPAHRHQTLLQMPGVTVLPSTFSRQSVLSATRMQVPHHEQLVLSMHKNFDESTITSDLVDHVTRIHGSVFDHEV